MISGVRDIGWAVVQQNLPDYALFGGLVLAALLVGMTRLGRPLQWAETFYHELSHGIACLLTLGQVQRITLKTNGSGSCTTRGGWRTLVLLSGYAGAALWGGTLYLVGAFLQNGGAILWLELEMAVLVIVMILWVRDLQTLAIILFLLGIYTLALLHGRSIVPGLDIIPWLLEFMGIYVLLNAIRAPLHLLDGQHVGDGAALQDIFVVVPEFVWVLMWFGFALLVLAFCAAQTLPGMAMALGLPRLV